MKQFHHISVFFRLCILLLATDAVHVYMYAQISCYVGSDKIFFAPGIGNMSQHSLCVWDGTTINSLVDGCVTKNGMPDSANPLSNKKITHLSPLHTGVLATVAHEPSIIYVAKQKDTMHVVSAEDVNDAQGNTCSEIVALEGITGQTPLIVAAVAPNNKPWGQSGSGLALITTAKTASKAKEQTTTAHIDNNEQKEGEATRESSKDQEADHKSLFTILNALTGALHGNCAVPLDGSAQSPVQINGGLGHMYDDMITLYWEPFIQRLYIGLHVKTAATASASQGAYALLMARIENNRLVVSSAIAPETIAANSNMVIGARGASQELYIQKMTSMHTSTALAYLICAGGATSPTYQNISLYALPITNVKSKVSARAIGKNSEHGMIASSNKPINVSFFNIKRGRFEGRQHVYPAQAPGDLPDMASAPILVGGSCLPQGTLVDLSSINDIVFAVVQHEGYQVLYKSHALFKEDGAIDGWTPWACVFKALRIMGCAQSSSAPFSVTYADDAGAIRTTSAQWLHVTTGSDESIKSLAHAIEQCMPPSSGGVTDVQQLLVSCHTRAERSVIGISGNSTFLVTEINKTLRSTITHTPLIVAQPLVFAQDTLKSVGYISSSCCVSDGARNWFVVGGMHGIAICADQAGNGFGQLPATDDERATFMERYAFTVFKKHPSVRIVVADESFLYVLTNDTLIRYTVDGHPDAWQAVTIADVSVIGQMYTQLSVHGACALLGTTHGLYRTGNGCDLRLATQPFDMQWTPVELPRTHGCSVQQLFTVGQSNVATKSSAHQIYMLGYCPLLKESYLFRLYINKAYNQVDEHSVQLVHEYACKDSLSSYLSIPVLINRYATDGLVHTVHATKPVQFLFSYPFLTGGKQLKAGKGYEPALHLPEEHKKVVTSCVLPNGDMMLGGSFGLAIYYL